jgi:ferritin
MSDSDFTRLLTAQVGNEFSASQQYVAVAVWFEQQTLPELAACFYRQAVEERNHAMMLLKFQMDTDRAVRLPGIAEPRSEFADPAEPIRLALEQERRVTDQITAMATAARAESDYQAEQFMQWFLKEQVEEVSSMGDLLKIVEHAGSNVLLVEDYLTREIAKAGGGGVDPTAPPAAGGAL